MIMAEIMSGFVIIVVAFMIVLESSKMIEEKKQRQRKGLTDYYDNPIKKDK